MLAASAAVAVPPAIDVVGGTTSGSLPKGVTVSHDGRRLFVTNYGNQNVANVAVFDASDLRRTATFNVPGIPVESAISLDDRTLFVSNFTRDSVQFIDVARGRVTREVSAGAHPKIVVLSHDGTKLYAANWGGASVSEIDVRRATVTRTLHAGLNPRGMAVTRAGRLYVANFNGHTIDVYDGEGLAQHHRIEPVCHIPRHLALSPDESTLFVSCFSASELLAINTATERFEHRVAVGTWPKAVDVSSDGRFVYTANYGGSSVTVVDTRDWIANTLDVPSLDHASGLAAAPTGFRFYVTGWYDGRVYAIDRAGEGPALTIAATLAASTLRRREFHRTHPAE